MVEAKRVQLPRLVVFALDVLILVIGLALVWADAYPLLGPGGTDPANDEIKDTAKSPVLFWCIGWPIVLIRKTVPAGIALIWTLGCVLAWVHIAVAFHLGHGWSHEAAWEHTRKVGGYGDGIFVNYAFALVWLADVVWVWALPGSYRARSRWLNWTIHGFLAFVVFNAAVVFGSWESRAWLLYWFLVSLVATLFGRWYVRRRSTFSFRSC